MYFAVAASKIEGLLDVIANNTVKSLVSELEKDEVFDSPDEVLACTGDFVELEHDFTPDNQKVYLANNRQILANFPIYQWIDEDPEMRHVFAVLNSKVKPEFTIL